VFFTNGKIVLIYVNKKDFITFIWKFWKLTEKSWKFTGKSWEVYHTIWLF